MVILDEALLKQGVDELATRVEGFGRIHQKYGYPPMWQRDPGFGTLIHIILEQQVSLASALAAYKKLCARLPDLTPASFLTLDDAELKACGFSRQKTRYGRELATAIVTGSLDLAALEKMEDEMVSAELTKIKGIGNWTANIYLLMVLRRANIWPPGDLALAAAAHDIFDLPKRPTYPELDEMALAWQPWRAVAARLLWHYYLSR